MSREFRFAADCPHRHPPLRAGGAHVAVRLLARCPPEPSRLPPSPPCEPGAVSSPAHSRYSLAGSPCLEKWLAGSGRVMDSKFWMPLLSKLSAAAAELCLSTALFMAVLILTAIVTAPLAP